MKKFPVRYARDLEGILYAFNPSPLTGEDLETYYINTMPVRTARAPGVPGRSPISRIERACKRPTQTNNTVLLLGHRGCGKSTELNKMAERLQKERYPVRRIDCANDLDLNNLQCDELLYLMGDALIQIVEEENVPVEDACLNVIRDFWNDVQSEMTVNSGSSVTAEASAGARVSSPVAVIGKFFADFRLTSELKVSTERRETVREKIRRRKSEWLRAMDRIADSITAKNDGRQPVLIFEDLDKVNPADALEVFRLNAANLSGVSFPVIYTFPIAASYDAKFAALSGYFRQEIFPMIKLETEDGQTYEDGYRAIEEIVRARADLSVFQSGVLERLIRMTGGSLRDLFFCIDDASMQADDRGDSKISLDDGEAALMVLESYLTRRMERKHYDFLKNIMGGNHENIEDKVMLLEMLQAGTVLEYNGKRWHNVHPLVAKFLTENEA